MHKIILVKGVTETKGVVKGLVKGVLKGFVKGVVTGKSCKYKLTPKASLLFDAAL